MRMPRFRGHIGTTAVVAGLVAAATAVAPGAVASDVVARTAEAPASPGPSGVHAPGTVAGWGLDPEYGRPRVPAGLDDVVKVDAQGYSGIALRADGTVVIWPDPEWYDEYGHPAWAAALTDVVDVAAGGAHHLALEADGTLHANGWDAYGQASVPDGLTDVVAIDAGSMHNLALRADGTVVAWGRNDYGQTDVPDGLDDVVQVSAGRSHSVALRADGTVVDWGGDARDGRTDPPAGLDDVVQVAAGHKDSVALRADGTVVTWGSRNPAQVPDGLTDVVSVAVESHVVALRADGTIEVFGVNDDGCCGTEVVPEALDDVLGVAAGVVYNIVVVDPDGDGPLPDTTGPRILTKGDISKAATSAKGARIWFEPTAVDDVFGPLQHWQMRCYTYRGQWFELGTTVVPCWATDLAGNGSDTTYEVRITWSWSGLLAPFAADGVSSFDHGEQVPVHFKLTKGSHGASDARATLAWAPVVDGDVGEYVPVTDAGSGAERFRWDGWKYVMRWDTGATPGPGTYSLRVDLGDGVERTSLVELR